VLLLLVAVLCLTGTSGSGLTRKQRSLVIMIIVFLSYLAMGALVDCYILNLRFIDGLYFSIVTIESELIQD
jgi:potassium channel subfamily K, other eukaryote